MKTRSVTVPPSKGFKKEVIDERYNTYPKRIDKTKDRKKDLLKEIELKRIKEKIKKKKETGKKDIFDYIGDILKTPYKIRGGAKHGKMMTKKFNIGGETMLKGGQKKLDKNKDGKISGEDFKMMKAKSGKMTSTSTKGNIRHGKLKSQEELKKITDSKEYKNSGYDKKTKMLNVATAKYGKMMKANMGTEVKSTQGYGAARTSGMGLQDENLIPGKSLDYYKDIM
jgi:hypothetical protein